MLSNQELLDLNNKFSLENLKDFYLDQYKKSKNNEDSTWYFALADCRGALEIFTDDVIEREHLLGLKTYWQDIDHNLFKGKENNEFIGINKLKKP